MFRKKPAVGTYTGMWSMKRMCRWILWKASWASVTKKPMGIWCKPVRRMGRGGLSDRPRGTGGSCSFDGIPADRRTKWTQGAGWTPPLVTKSIQFCWLFTIKEKCKKCCFFKVCVICSCRCPRTSHDSVLVVLEVTHPSRLRALDWHRVSSNSLWRVWD